MLSLRIVEFGPPEKLKLENLPTPELQPGESLVEVHAAGINPSDLGNALGRFPQTRLPRTPGRDFAGIVVKGGTRAIGIGSGVWGTGAEFGFTRDGSHADRIVVPDNALCLKPASLSMAQAGVVGVPFVTGLLTVRASDLKPGDALIVNGARGAVGSAAAQIARLHGIRVVGLGRDDDLSDPEFPVFDSSRPDVVDALLDLTGGGAHACIDTVGGPLFALGLRGLRVGGRMVVITAQGDGSVTLDLRDFYHRQLLLVGIDSLKTFGAQAAAALSELHEGFETGKLIPPNVTGVPLTDAVSAYARLNESAKTGASAPKTVLTM